MIFLYLQIPDPIFQNVVLYLALKIIIPEISFQIVAKSIKLFGSTVYMV